MKNSVIISLIVGMCVFVCSGMFIFGLQDDDTTLHKQLAENHLKYFLIGKIAKKFDCKGLAPERNIKMFTKLLYAKEVADHLAAKKREDKELGDFFAGFYSPKYAISEIITFDTLISRTTEGKLSHSILATPLPDRIDGYITEDMPRCSRVTNRPRTLDSTLEETRADDHNDIITLQKLVDDFNCDVD